MEKKKVAFYTLGCKLNYAETSTIGRMMEEEGFETVAFDKASDVYVINTCSVTDNADKKCRAVIRQAKRQSPESMIVVVGCYAQLKPKEISEIQGVDLVLGAAEKFNLAEHLKELTKEEKGKYISCEVEAANFFVHSFSVGERTRSFLKVQDGCDYTCAFCTIPQARGRSRSDSIENVVKNAQLIGEMGVSEVVLTGVNIGDFGKGFQGARKTEEHFIDLIKALDQVQGIQRFRISSIEPNLLSKEIINFVADSQRFMPHFHIPLQSGCNKLLKLMRRRYQRELYAERVALIKERMPHCCIGVDVIVGFPSETEEDFLETYQFLNELDVSYLHVFTYSERANTAALDIQPVVPKAERSRRSKMLRILSEKKRRHFYEQHLGATRSVLFEGEEHKQQMHGFTDNYVKVTTAFDAKLINQTKLVQLQDINADNTVNVLMQEAETVPSHKKR